MTELEAMVRVKELIQKPNLRERMCLSCGTVFFSSHNGHRVCAICRHGKSHYGIRAAKTCGLMLDRLKSFKDNE